MNHSVDFRVEIWNGKETWEGWFPYLMPVPPNVGLYFGDSNLLKISQVRWLGEWKSSKFFEDVWSGFHYKAYFHSINMPFEEVKEELEEIASSLGFEWDFKKLN